MPLLKVKDRLKDKFTRERISAGLDIGNSSIKSVKLKFFREQVELCGFSLEPFALDPGKALMKIKQSQTVPMANIAVSGPSAIIRYVSFPRITEEELRHALRYEAQKHIPFPIDEVNLDSYILKEDLTDNKDLVLLAAVKKEIIYQRLKFMEEAGIKVNIIDIDSIALINAFGFNYPKEDKAEHEVIALLNIGDAITNLNILEDRIPHLSRDIPIAGRNFTQKIQDTLGIDFQSAEELKLNPDKDRRDKIFSAFELALANLATELRTSFDYYESQSASSVTKIFLSGGSVLFAGLKDMLANLLGIEVEYWDPFRKISIPDSIDSGKLKALQAQLAVAVGLALR